VGRPGPMVEQPQGITAVLLVLLMALELGAVEVALRRGVKVEPAEREPRRAPMR